MDWKRFDRVRREVGPVHLDLVESYAGGKISRRDFVRRGTLLGLSAPFIGTVIAAIGRRRGSITIAGVGRHPGASEHGTTRRDDQGRLSDPRRGDRPGAHAGPQQLRADRPMLRVPDHSRRRRRDRTWPRRIVGAQRGRHRVDVPAPPGRHVAGRWFAVHVRRCCGDDGSPRRGRQRGAAGRDRRRRRRRQRPQRRGVQPRRPQWQPSRTWCRCSTPKVRSRRSTTRSGTTLDASRTAPVHGCSPASTRPRERRSSAIPTGGAARPRSTPRRCSSSATSGRWSRRCRAAPPTPSCSSRSSAATPC